MLVGTMFAQMVAHTCRVAQTVAYPHMQGAGGSAHNSDEIQDDEDTGGGAGRGGRGGDATAGPSFKMPPPAKREAGSAAKPPAGRCGVEARGIAEIGCSTGV